MIVYGCAGYMIIEGFSFLDALFMTVITITTVGYGEVHPLGAVGQVFTITVIVFGVIGFLYTFGVLVELFSSERWREHWRSRRIDADLEKLRDHVIVCGYGRTGTQVARQLDTQQHPFVVVEMNPAPMVHVIADGRLHVEGDAASEEVLERAGIHRARAVVSAVDNDERSVYIVLTARSMNPDVFIIARSSYPESVSKLRIAGADRVVSPYTISGHRMAALALQPAVIDTLDTMLSPTGDSIAIEELVVPPEPGAPLSVASLKRGGATVLAVRTAAGGLAVGPSDEEQLGPNDLVVAMGTRAQLTELETALHPRGHRPRRQSSQPVQWGQS